MANLAQEELTAPRNLEHRTVGSETEPQLQARSSREMFSPSLTLGVLGTRWLRSFATPCHARGASL